jgi:hypothetical protein
MEIKYCFERNGNEMLFRTRSEEEPNTNKNKMLFQMPSDDEKPNTDGNKMLF